LIDPFPLRRLATRFVPPIGGSKLKIETTLLALAAVTRCWSSDDEDVGDWQKGMAFCHPASAESGAIRARESKLGERSSDRDPRKRDNAPPSRRAMLGVVRIIE